MKHRVCSSSAKDMRRLWMTMTDGILSDVFRSDSCFVFSDLVYPRAARLARRTSLRVRLRWAGVSSCRLYGDIAEDGDAAARYDVRHEW